MNVKPTASIDAEMDQVGDLDVDYNDDDDKGKLRVFMSKISSSITVTSILSTIRTA